MGTLTQPFHNQEDQENLTSRTHQKLSNMKVYVAILLALAIFLPLMCTVEAQSDADVETKETPNEKNERKIELEDLQLWKTMDLNKDGKLTVAEYERFARSPAAQSFVRNMKERKAVEQWAAKIGIGVAKAKAAMMLGAHAQRRRSYIARQQHARIMANRRRHAIYRRNKMIAYKRRQQRQNFFSRLGQQYYTAMKRSGQRGGEL